MKCVIRRQWRHCVSVIIKKGCPHMVLDVCAVRRSRWCTRVKFAAFDRLLHVYQKERKYGATWLDLHPLRENWIYRNKKKKNKFLNQLENDVSLITNAKILLYRRRTIVTPFSSTSRANWERFSRDLVFLAKRKKNEMARQVGNYLIFFCLLLFSSVFL